MLRRCLFLAFFITGCLKVMAGPLDSLRLELREGRKFIIHRVIKSETLASLAQRYGVEESAILSNNPLVTDKVYPGQVLKIPVNESRYGNVQIPPVVPLTGSRLPLAQTLPSPPSKKQGSAQAQQPVSSQETTDVENVVKVEQPESKSVEAVSTTPEPPTDKNSNKPETPKRKIIKTNVYVVASSQTVNQLANSFNVDVNDVIEINQLKNYRLKEGQKVKIPVYSDEPVAVSVKSTPKTEEKKVAEEKKAESSKPVEPVEAKQNEQKPSQKPAEPMQKKEEARKTEASQPVVLPIAKKEDKPVASIKEDKKDAKQSTQAVAKAPEKKTENKETPPAPTPDSLNASGLKKMKALAYLDHLDTAYEHPDGIAYKVFDFRETDYQHDVYTMRLDEENAIEVPTTNQRQGYGNKSITHVVKRDETLQSIARKYKISATDIINWNGLLDYRVREGQELVINSQLADIAPYLRTVPDKVAPINPQARIEQESAIGLAYFNPKKKIHGVFIDNVSKGKFIYVLNRDNFTETFVKVLGPLPKGLPKGTILMVDEETAKVLGINTQLSHVEVWFDLMVDAPAAENKNTDKTE